MSGIIKILPQFIANRIAAGEVVGRPESVVKELIENSIDANASEIVLRIKDAGKILIQVDDDGDGMSEDDAMMCFMRHSTSKIKEAEDLDKIKTLGFRGEALASISAVSQVELKTKNSADELGISIKNHGSEILEHSNIKFEKGTSVAVKNLFFNTPARRNFLKSNQTEFRHIHDTFVRLSISHPDIAFIFINNDELVYDLKPSDMLERINSFSDSDSSEKLIEVNFDNNTIKVFGFVSKPAFTRKTKQDQLLFLNNRYVVSKSLSYAVHLAYSELIEKGDYPDFYIFLTIDPVRCDVNVHPSKLEVKFDDEKIVFSAIRKAVWKALESNDLVFKVNLSANTEPVIHTFKQTAVHADPGFNFSGKTTAKIHELFDERSGIRNNEASFNNNEDSFIIDDFIESGDENKKNLETSADQPVLGYNLIWQFRKKYIMYQLENYLMIIDQHAAHERILYEQAVDRLNSNAHLSQQLLIPIVLEYDAVDFEVLKSIESELKALGFDFDLQSKGKLKLTGIPSDVRVGNEAKILKDVIDMYKENDVKLNLDKRDNLAKSYACKHAIRTGDYLTNDEMLNLIDRLFLTKLPYVCPHGRPTIIKISLDELDKKFARIL